MDTQLVEKLARYGIDLPDAMNRMDNNLAIYERLSVKYLENTNFVGLKAALDVDDFDSAYSAAHALKGVSGNLSFTKLFKSSSAICKALLQGEGEIARAIFPEIEEEHNLVVQGLMAWQDGNL
jgi:HPt (histidine-containing phosphotransfer) domain-containing protein